MKLSRLHIFLTGFALLFSGHFSWSQRRDTVQVNEWNDLARKLLNENRFEESLAIINKAEKKAGEMDWKQGLLKVYSTKSSVQNIYNRHYEAIATGLKGLQLAKELNNDVYEVLFYRSLANNNDMLDNYGEAIPYYRKCIEKGEKLPAARLTLGHCYVEIGDAYRLHLKKPAEARELIEKGIAIYSQIDSSALGYAYDYLGEALTDLGLFAEAERIFKQSLSVYRQNGEEYLIPELLFHTANMYLAQKKFPNAIKTAKEGLKVSREMKTVYGESEAHLSLYKSYKETGNPEKALEHFEAYIVLRDSLTKANIDNHFEQIKTEARLQKQESELKELQLKQQQDAIRNQQLLVVTLVILLLLAAFLVIYFRRVNKRIQSKNKRISEALLSGQATERQRLSREIRDLLGANISSVLWSFELLDISGFAKEVRETILSLKNNLSETYSRVNLLSKNIIPDELESAGLTDSLRSLIKKTNETEQAYFELILPENFKGTEPKIEFEFYNIVLELLLMCRKLNCKTGSFEIALAGRRVGLNFKSADDGRLAESDDLLLEQIALRVESLNGKMKISESENSEIQVSCRIPN